MTTATHKLYRNGLRLCGTARDVHRIDMWRSVVRRDKLDYYSKFLYESTISLMAHCYRSEMCLCARVLVRAAREKYKPSSWQCRMVANGTIVSWARAK